MTNRIVCQLVAKSTQKIDGKVKYVRGGIVVDGTFLPMSVVQFVINNTVFYTKGSILGEIESTEEKNGYTLYHLVGGITVTVIAEDSTYVVMPKAVSAPVEEEDDEEEAEDDVEDEESEEDDDSDDEEESDDDSDDEEESDDDEEEEDEDSEEEDDEDLEEDDEEEESDDEDEESEDDDEEYDEDEDEEEEESSDDDDEFDL